jgi:biotin carboxylase
MEELVIIVGGGIFQVPAIREAKKMGYQVLVLDQSPEAPGFSDADHCEFVSTKDIAAARACARAYARTHRVVGVFTAGTDVAYTVASIAECLGLPGISPEAALHATNKFLMRSRLSEHGVSCPRFFMARSCEEACSAARSIGYPLVIKPVDNMGARGVRRIDTEAQLREQFDTSIAYSGNYAEAAVIIEEYMDGAEISMDTIVDETGRIHLLTIADRHIVFPPYFVEIGHSIPSRLAQEKLDEAFELMQKAIRAIGITCGAAKADIKITSSGAKIGEITARLSGGFHSQCTEALATGMNSTKAALDLAVGKALDIKDITPRLARVAIERAIIPESGKILKIEGIENARNAEGIYDVILTKKEGDSVRSLENNIGKIGHIIASGNTYTEAESAYERARSMITVAIEKEPVTTGSDLG